MDACIAWRNASGSRMEQLVAVAYQSVAVTPLDTRELDELLMDARAFNAKAQISGALLHHNGLFLQYFEGPPVAVAAVYFRIRQSRRHGQLTELLHEPILVREFARWQMAFAEAPRSVLEQISNEAWVSGLPSLRDRQVRSPGLQLLLDFWDVARRSAPSQQGPN